MSKHYAAEELPQTEHATLSDPSLPSTLTAPFDKVSGTTMAENSYLDPSLTKPEIHPSRR